MSRIMGRAIGGPGRLGLTLPRPRLLPFTSAAMAALLMMKSAGLVRAAATGAVAAPPKSAAATASPSAPAQAAGSGASRPAGPAAPPPASVSEEERALLLDLRHRREMLDDRARQLADREAEMAAAGRKLDARVQQLAALQARLEALEVGRQARQAADWAGLVKTYEAMKPRDAAAIFDALDMQVLLQVLDRMQERRAAAVLAAMQPDRARLATQLLAEMRTRANTPRDAATQTDPSGPVATKPNPKG